MQPFPHHGMDTAVELFFFVTVRTGAIGEMLHSARALGATGADDFNHDTADGAREAGPVEHGVNLLLHSLRFA